MLDVCLPGWSPKEKTHRLWISGGNPRKTYRGFPKGKHGKTNPEIEVGQIKSLANFFGIIECAKRQLPQLP